MTPAERGFLNKVLTVFAVACGALLLWALRYVALLLFNAVLASLFLQALYGPLVRRGMPRAVALAGVALGLVLIVGLAAAFFGWRIEQQVSEAAQLLPQALADLRQRLSATALGSRLLADASHVDPKAALSALLRLPGYALSVTAALADVLLVVFGGLFISAQPGGYHRGLLVLTPPAWRGRLGPFLHTVGELLRKWLIAQMIAMVTVGLLIGAGLAVVGVPAAGALGLFAAAAEFVPIAGPIASAVPALLLASLHGWDKVAWTLLLFVLVQQFESNLLIPLLQRRIVRLAPLLVLFALLTFEVLFGFLGVILAAPLIIVVKAAAETFYLSRTPEP